MRVHFVIGPTASGKSSFAVSLAQELHTEVVGADSVQIYRGFDIGSAKITEEERQGIRHHLIDCVEPTTPFSVMDYREMTMPVVEEVYRRTGEVIVCGGTGFYINSLLFELDDLPCADPDLRSKLNAMDLEELLGHAAAIGMKLAHTAQSNKRRVVRAIEIFHSTGKEPGRFRDLRRTGLEPIFHYISPERAVLYERIHQRVDAMIRSGLVEETEALIARYGRDVQPMRSIGYAEAARHLAGEYSPERMADEIKTKTRHYAKRQITWFKRYRELGLYF